MFRPEPNNVGERAKIIPQVNKKAKKENEAFNLEEIANQFPGKLASTLQKHMKP